METKAKRRPEGGPKKLGLKDLEVYLDLGAGRRKVPSTQWARYNYVVVPAKAWIRSLRRRHKLSFHDFGGVVGVQAADVKAWEIGKSAPSGPACRLMGLLDQKPYLVDFMRRRRK